MNQRLEQILGGIARQHAPELLQPGWQSDLPVFARRLTSYGHLTIVGRIDAPDFQNAQPQLEAWVNLYVDFYNLLAGALFPSYTDISAQFGDGQLPAIVVISGQCVAVVKAFHSILVPYMIEGQAQVVPSDAGIASLIDMLLDDLEARDLPPAEFMSLRARGIEFLRALYHAPVQELPLATARRAPSPAQPQQLPEAPPAHLPESDLPANPVLPDLPADLPPRMPPVPPLPENL